MCPRKYHVHTTLNVKAKLTLSSGHIQSVISILPPSVALKATLENNVLSSVISLAHLQRAHLGCGGGGTYRGERPR